MISLFTLNSIIIITMSFRTQDKKRTGMTSSTLLPMSKLIVLLFLSCLCRVLFSHKVLSKHGF